MSGRKDEARSGAAPARSVAPGIRAGAEGRAWRRTEKLPRCSGCGSLERHRIFRLMFERLGPQTSGAGAIQFSPDPTVDPRGSRRLTLVFGEPEREDIQAIDRPDGAYDSGRLLARPGACGRRPRSAKELLRIAAPDGLVYLAFPDPFREAKTRDWGFAKPEKHGHFRVYGGDVVQRFCTLYTAAAGRRLFGRGPGDGRARRRFPAAEIGHQAPDLGLAATRSSPGFSPDRRPVPQTN